MPNHARRFQWAVAAFVVLVSLTNVGTSAAAGSSPVEGHETVPSEPHPAYRDGVWGAGNGGHHRLPGEGPETGLSLDGLVVVGAGSGCAGGYELLTVVGLLCTHGPDAAPAGVDVRVPMVPTGGTDPGPGDDPGPDARSGICERTSGSRVQAVYAVPAGQPDRYDALVPSIRAWAAAVDRVFLDSSEAHGGPAQRPRWVLGADCAVDVIRVRLSAAGAETFRATIDDLAAHGLDRRDRKYLVWTDATVYCGIANYFPDARPGQDNPNNGHAPSYGRIDSACWGRADPVEAHELVHMLGGIHASAPNATDRGHCTDGHDLMCYPDAPGVQTRAVCPPAWSRLLDCGGNDYYNPGRPTGWLARNWNTADSTFLLNGGTARASSAGGHRHELADVPPGAYYAPAVDWAHHRGITTGCAPGRFCPNHTLTRAQMTTLLWRLHDSPRTTPANFSDVPPGAYYAPAVDWAHHRGITTGCAPGRFCPNHTLTRAQMTTLLWRLHDSPRTTPANFSDVPPGAYYAPAVDWAHHRGITTGCAPGRFCPNHTLTRAQMTTLLWRLHHAGAATGLTQQPIRPLAASEHIAHNGSSAL
jgi:hypothetical protein